MNAVTILVFIVIFLILLSLIYLFFRFRLIFYFFLIALIILMLRSGVFVVNEGTQAVITQFGAIIGQPYLKAGLYFKVPFVWKVNYLDKRIFRETELQAVIPTSDGYLITVDEIFNWRISDPALFIQTMNGVDEARNFIKNNVSGSIRQAVSSHTLLSLVRSYNKASPIATFLPSLREQLDLQDSNKKELAKNELLGLSIVLVDGRALLAEAIKNQANQYMKQYGIEIIAVLIRSVVYEKSVEDRIDARMIQERLREAERLRSSGRSELERIRGLLKKKYQSIIAPAEQQALAIMGKAEAEATRIQAEAYDKDRNFYNYWRSLRIYKDALPDKSQGVILSTDSILLKWLIEGDQKFNYSAPPQVKKE